LSLRSKLIGYQNAVCPDGLMRYSLHQLRTEKDDDGIGMGTITGRFSSGKLVKANKRTGQKDIGKNIQQEAKNTRFDKDKKYAIRRLHKAAPGHLRLSADARQIEYRLFASYARNQAILDAYKKNPLISFHDQTFDILSPYVPGLTYDDVKTANFLRLYGGGIVKLATNLKIITPAQAAKLSGMRYAELRHQACLAQAWKIDDAYNSLIPEGKDLIKHCGKIAEERGYVLTFLKRRARFYPGDRFYKALNGVLQGGGADYAKMKAVELHRERKALGYIPRFVVHDSNEGDTIDVHHARKINAFLDEQSFPSLAVPLLWECKIGPNWADQEKVAA
jgi:DNA polymerase I-like protein with 3'-5' exonuclease and polymerase domains